MGKRRMDVGHWWKVKEKGSVGRPERRWVDNIKIDLSEIEWGRMDRIGLSQDRDQCKTLVGTAMNHRVPKNAGKLLSSCATSGFSRRAQLHGVTFS
jgi:hypothetical protein